jgi:hypothetical protein
MVENTVNRLSIRELIVDFLGSLVPGLVFTAIAITVFIWPTVSLLAVISQLREVSANTGPLSLAEPAAKVLNSVWIEILLFTLMVSYVVGHLFYRQDPKEPDKKSFNRVKESFSKREDEDGAKNWVVQEDKYCEFPYPNLKGYLKFRGLSHLAELVPWEGWDFKDNNRVQRTKNFINIMKIRLDFHFPDKYVTIARNEAHVRLMSSTWYMSKLLRGLSISAFLVALAALLMAWSIKSSSRYPIIITYSLPVAFTFFMILAMNWIKSTIEAFLHYQRVREVIFVLETVYTAFQKEPQLIRDICPDYLQTYRDKEKSVGAPMHIPS